MSTLAKTPLSPAQKQYRRVKAKHPGFILFFRIGDFNELFWADAEVAASVLGLTLTTRNCSSPEAIAMAGLPLPALEESLNKMTASGYRCAVFDTASGGRARRKVMLKMFPAALSWRHIPGDAISADLSCAGPYVISHRPREHTVSYRPPREHHPLGVFATEDEAKNAAQRHAKPPPVKRRSLIAEVERELHERGIPSVAVSEAKKALFKNVQLKAFHFVVYAKEGDHWLLWCGEPTAAVRQEMADWAQAFGEDFQVVFAFRRAGGIVYRTASGIRLKLDGKPAAGSLPTGTHDHKPLPASAITASLMLAMRHGGHG